MFDMFFQQIVTWQTKLNKNSFSTRQLNTLFEPSSKIKKNTNSDNNNENEKTKSSEYYPSMESNDTNKTHYSLDEEDNQRYKAHTDR